MAVTTNYDLTLYDDQIVVDEVGFQRYAKVIDRVVGSLAIDLAVKGVFSGWSITAGKTVTAGNGFVNGSACTTSAPVDISSELTNSSVNYVYAVTDSTSAPDGTVVFDAVTSVGAIPAAAVRLGSITLDGGGAVTDQDDNPAAALRDQLKPLRHQVTAEITITDTIPIGGTKVFTVDHTAQVDFAIPLNVNIVSSDPSLNIVVLANGRTGTGFKIKVWNDWVTGDGLGYLLSGDIQIILTADGFV